MSEYHPDKFTLLEINPDEEETFYKVFGTWGGSYLYGDSWRMNSGIERAVMDSGMISFIGRSGSVYSCNISSEGISGASGRGTLQGLLDKYKDQIRVVTLQECIDNKYFPIEEAEEDL
jgi:hypothetical protein